MDPTLDPNFAPPSTAATKTRIPNQAISVHSYHLDSPPLGPAQSSRDIFVDRFEEYNRAHSRNNSRSHPNIYGNGNGHNGHNSRTGRIVHTISSTLESEQGLPALDLGESIKVVRVSSNQGEPIFPPSLVQVVSKTPPDGSPESQSPALHHWGSPVLAPPLGSVEEVSPLSQSTSRFASPYGSAPASRPSSALGLKQTQPHQAPSAESGTSSSSGHLVNGVGTLDKEEENCEGDIPCDDDLPSSSRLPRLPPQAETREAYSFPRQRLRTTMKDDTKEPLIIVACGSFSPCTYLHLRIFEMARDAVYEGGKYEIIGGYYSPVSDAYKKAGLAPAKHRVRMCELAVDKTSEWLMVDAWESLQPEYQRTAVVLDHFDQELNGEGGVTLRNGSKRKIKIMLLAGGDLIQSFGEPGVWSEPDLHHILGKFGCLIVERTGSDVWAFLLSHDILYKHRSNIIVVKQIVYNDISSTKVRLFVRRGMSIRYLLPQSVVQYIYEHKLYQSPDASAKVDHS